MWMVQGLRLPQHIRARKPEDSSSLQDMHWSQFVKCCAISEQSSSAQLNSHEHLLHMNQMMQLASRTLLAKDPPSCPAVWTAQAICVRVFTNGPTNECFGKSNTWVHVCVE